jgi:hypothetical protein
MHRSTRVTQAGHFAFGVSVCVEAPDGLCLASLWVRASMLGWAEISCSEVDLEYSVHE